MQINMHFVIHKIQLGIFFGTCNTHQKTLTFIIKDSFHKMAFDMAQGYF